MSDARAQRLRARVLDGIGVRDGDEAPAAMALGETADGVAGARLHLEKRLAAREPEAARMGLDDPPLGLLRQPPERAARPRAEVALEQAGLHAHRHAARLRQRRRRLSRALHP